MKTKKLPPPPCYTYTTNTTTSTQVHQNWGWGASNGSDPNDWYSEGVFQAHSWSNNFNRQVTIVAYIGQP